MSSRWPNLCLLIRPEKQTWPRNQENDKKMTKDDKKMTKNDKKWQKITKIYIKHNIISNKEYEKM